MLLRSIGKLFHARVAPALLPAFVVGASAACGTTNYDVISKTTPNPFAGKSDFEVTPIDFTGLRVGKRTEQDFLASLSPSSAKSFRADKTALDDKFQSSLAARAKEDGITVVPGGGASAQTFVIHPYVRFIEPGFATIYAPSRVEMTVVITDASGKVLDKFYVDHETTSVFFTNLASGQRLRVDGAALGEFVAEYLRDRTLH